MTSVTESRKFGKQATLTSPFVCLQGRWYVVVQWRPDQPVPPTLTLRALSDAEASWLVPQLVDATTDVWARMFPSDHEILTGAVFDDEDD